MVYKRLSRCVEQYVPRYASLYATFLLTLFAVTAQATADVAIDFNKSGVRVQAQNASLGTLLRELGRRGGFELSAHASVDGDEVNLEYEAPLEELLARLLRHQPHAIEYVRVGGNRKVVRLTLLTARGGRAGTPSLALNPRGPLEETPGGTVPKSESVKAVGPTALLNRHATPGLVARVSDHIANADLIEDARLTAMKPWESAAREARAEQRAVADAGDAVAAVADQDTPTLVPINETPEFEALQAKLAPITRNASRNVQALAASLREAEAAAW